MTNEQVLNNINDSIKDIKNDIQEVNRNVTRINTILEGAGNGGIIGDLKKVEKKVDKLEDEWRQERDKMDAEIEKIKAKVWTWGGAFAVLVVVANFLLPKIIG